MFRKTNREIYNIFSTDQKEYLDIIITNVITGI